MGRPFINAVSEEDRMNGLLASLQGAVAQGVLWGIMVLGVYITFRLMDIADLTVDGSFALGACVCAVLVVNKQVNPIVALFAATAAGRAIPSFKARIATDTASVPPALSPIKTTCGYLCTTAPYAA